MGSRGLRLSQLGRLYQRDVVSEFDVVQSPTETIRAAVETAVYVGRARRTAILLTMRHFVEHGELDRERRDAVLIPTIEYLTQRLQPFSHLTNTELHMAIFGVIMLVGRLIAFTQEDLSSVGSFASEQSIFIDATSDLVSRMLGITPDHEPTPLSELGV